MMKGREWISSWLSLLLLSFTNIQTVLADKIALPEIQYDAIGQLGFAGAFAGISPFKDTRQFEALSDPTQSSVLINNNGTFELLASSNGVINTICSTQNGSNKDEYNVYIGGSFTMLNNDTFNNIARFDTSSNTFSSLGQGLDGGVHALLCDSDAVYVGGDFSAPVGASNDSLPSYGGHAAIWVPSNNSWIPVPWKGFNGPVYTITRNTDRDTVLFGGRFDATGDGQYFNSNTSQTVNMGSPTEVTSGNGATSGNYSDPSSIICNRENASQVPWLLQDGVPGYWEASFGYPVQPSLFRLGNAHYDGRGTQTFSIIALGSNEYFELSYTNTTTHETITCTTDCVLSNDPTVSYQDFTVLNPITTNAIRIQIDSWYGAGGGLSSVEIFESDIGVYPRISSGTDNSCSNASYALTNVTGNWQEQFVYGTYQKFLTISIPASELTTSNASVTYYPSIPAQGVYIVYALTPGCVGSSSCDERTQVDLSMQFSPGSAPITVTIDQSTTSDQNTLIYSGFIASASGSYRPSVTLTVAANATATSDTVTVFAETLQFFRNGTNATLSSILEYSPQNYSQNIQPAWSPLSEQLAAGSTVHSIDASRGNVLYIGGQFSNTNNTYRNVVSYDYQSGHFVPLPNNGVNGTVYATLATDSALFVAGAFENLAVASTEGQYDNLAMLSFSTSTWAALGQGVNGPVDKLWISADNNTLNVSGNFSIAVVNNSTTIPSAGNAVWDISSQQWIDRTFLLVGSVVGSQQLNDTATLLVGQIRAAQTYRADGAATFSSPSTWTSFLFGSSEAIINSGVFWHNATGNHNETAVIVGGRFRYNNISNLALYQDGIWTGIGQLEGEIKSLALLQDRLYIAGNFSGSFYNNQPVSFAIFDLKNRTNVDVGSVYGDNNTPGIVEIVKSSPDGKAVYIAGNFTNVGSLNCPSVCKLDTELLQWNLIANGISGHAYDLMVNNDELVVVGDITVNNQPASVAQIASQASTWTAKSFGTSQGSFGTPTVILEGPDQMIIGGSNNSAGYIGTWDGQQFIPLTTNLGPSSQLEQMMFVPVTSSPSGSSYPANSNSMLLIAGHLNLEKYGNVSAAIYDGSEWFPYALTSQLQGTSGLLRQIFHESQCCTASNIRHYLPVPAVILISIAISLGVIFVLVAAGLAVLFIRRRNADPDAPEPMGSYMPVQNRNSRLMEMLDTAQAGTLGAGAAAAIAGAAAAGPSKEKTIDEPTSSTGDTDSPRAGVISGGATSFAALMAAAAANANSTAPASDESPRLYEAKYPFEAKEYGELGFESGEPIVVTDTSDNVWWMGYKDDGSGKPVSGLFPSNYVTEKKQV